MQPKKNSWVVRKIGYGATSVLLAAMGIVMMIIAGDWESLTSGIVMLIGAVSSMVATTKTTSDSDASADHVTETVAERAAQRAIERLSPPVEDNEPTGMAGYYAQREQ